MSLVREEELRALLRDPATNVDNAKAAGFEALDIVKDLQAEKTDLEERFNRFREGLRMACLQAPINPEIIEPLLVGDNMLLTREVKLLRSMVEPGGQQKFLLHLVDVVWGNAMEDGQVPSTSHALNLIERAKETLNDDSD
jgi:hypothetical protein